MTRRRFAALYAVVVAWLGAAAVAGAAAGVTAAVAATVAGALPVLAVGSYLTAGPAPVVEPSRRDRHRAELDEWLWDYRLAAAYAPLPGDDAHLHRAARDGYRGGPPASLRPDGTLHVRVPQGPGGGSRRALRPPPAAITRPYAEVFGCPPPPPPPPATVVHRELR